MPLVDVMDSSWLRARPQAVATIVADPAAWRRWWPGLHLVVTEKRAERGLRWQVVSVEDVPGLTGTAELWLQPQGEGVVAHFFLRLDAAPGHPVGAQEVERVRRHYRRRTKLALWALGDQLDPRRLDRHTCTGAG